MSSQIEGIDSSRSHPISKTQQTHKAVPAELSPVPIDSQAHHQLIEDLNNLAVKSKATISTHIQVDATTQPKIATLRERQTIGTKKKTGIMGRVNWLIRQIHKRLASPEKKVQIMIKRLENQVHDLQLRQQKGMISQSEALQVIEKLEAKKIHYLEKTLKGKDAEIRDLIQNDFVDHVNRLIKIAHNTTLNHIPITMTDNTLTLPKGALHLEPKDVPFESQTSGHYHNKAKADIYTVKLTKRTPEEVYAELILLEEARQLDHSPYFTDHKTVLIKDRDQNQYISVITPNEGSPILAITEDKDLPASPSKYSDSKNLTAIQHVLKGLIHASNQNKRLSPVQADHIQKSKAGIFQINYLKNIDEGTDSSALSAEQYEQTQLKATASLLQKMVIGGALERDRDVQAIIADMNKDDSGLTLESALIRIEQLSNKEVHGTPEYELYQLIRQDPVALYRDTFKGSKSLETSDNRAILRQKIKEFRQTKRLTPSDHQKLADLQTFLTFTETIKTKYPVIHTYMYDTLEAQTTMTKIGPSLDLQPNCSDQDFVNKLETILDETQSKEWFEEMATGHLESLIAVTQHAQHSTIGQSLALAKTSTPLATYRGTFNKLAHQTLNPTERATFNKKIELHELKHRLSLAFNVSLDAFLISRSENLSELIGAIETQTMNESLRKSQLVAVAEIILLESETHPGVSLDHHLDPATSIFKNLEGANPILTNSLLSSEEKLSQIRHLTGTDLSQKFSKVRTMLNSLLPSPEHDATLYQQVATTHNRAKGQNFATFSHALSAVNFAARHRGDKIERAIQTASHIMAKAEKVDEKIATIQARLDEAGAQLDQVNAALEKPELRQFKTQSNLEKLTQAAKEMIASVQEKLSGLPAFEDLKVFTQNQLAAITDELASWPSELTGKSDDELDKLLGVQLQTKQKLEQLIDHLEQKLADIIAKQDDPLYHCTTYTSQIDRIMTLYLADQVTQSNSLAQVQSQLKQDPEVVKNTLIQQVVDTILDASNRDLLTELATHSHQSISDMPSDPLARSDWAKTLLQNYELLSPKGRERGVTFLQLIEQCATHRYHQIQQPNGGGIFNLNQVYLSEGTSLKQAKRDAEAHIYDHFQEKIKQGASILETPFAVPYQSINRLSATQPSMTYTTKVEAGVGIPRWIGTAAEAYVGFDVHGGLSAGQQNNLTFRHLDNHKIEVEVGANYWASITARASMLETLSVKAQLKIDLGKSNKLIFKTPADAQIFFAYLDANAVIPNLETREDIAQLVDHVLLGNITVKGEAGVSLSAGLSSNALVEDTHIGVDMTAKGELSLQTTQVFKSPPSEIRAETIQRVSRYAGRVSLGVSALGKKGELKASTNRVLITEETNGKEGKPSTLTYQQKSVTVLSSQSEIEAYVEQHGIDPGSLPGHPSELKNLTVTTTQTLHADAQKAVNERYTQLVRLKHDIAMKKIDVRSG